MRILLRVGIVLGLLLLLGFIGLVLALPRIAASDAMRERLRAAALEATGQEVSYDELSFGLLPPRLVIRGPRVSGRDETEEPAIAAESVDLKLAWLPLLARSVVIRSLRVDGVSLRLVRTEDGIELPLRRPPPEPATEKGPEREDTQEEGDSDGFGVAVAGLELRHSQLLLEDRTVSPAVIWELVDLDATARGRSLTHPVELQASGRLKSGGNLRLSGKVALDGDVDLAAKLEGVVLDPAAPYLSSDLKLLGAVSGDLKARGPAVSPSSLDADLVFTDASLDLEDVSFRGRLAVRANLEGGLEHPSGPFEIDATDARIDYGSSFSKPRGDGATATGRLVREPDGDFDVEDMHLKLYDVDARGRLHRGSRMRLDLEAAPFELAGWEQRLPALAPFAPSGTLAVPELSIRSDPLDVRGRADLRNLSLRPSKREPVTMNGSLQGEGNALRSSGLVAIVAGQRVELDAEVTRLAKAPRYRVRASTEGADVNALLAALAGLDGTLYGPLTGSADLHGPVGGAGEPIRALRGRARFRIEDGRLKGVSLLASTFDRVGTLGQTALLAGQLSGKESLQRFYGDEFESMSGTFDLGDGRARTDDLQLVYRNYRADLRGMLGLLDESLDFTGKLTIDEELDAELSGADGKGEPPRPRVIPLARVRGTLSSPRVELTQEAVLALGIGHSGSRKRNKLEHEIDERLGEGSGREVLDALEGILGGRRE